MLKQGAHVDPTDPSYRRPERASLPVRWGEVVDGDGLAAYREALLAPGAADLRASILDDLSTYYRFSPDECIRRCVTWEEWSVQEWYARPRDTPEALADFYNSLQSWSFDLLWYAYLQAEGCEYPTGAVIARTLPPPTHAPYCLDFGSGVGDMAGLLLRLGYQVDLADVSKTLLAFARYRLERRGQQARYIDLNEETLDAGRYDVVIAKDVLVHVPDFRATVTMLHRALRPGGRLYANIDARPPTPENAWHLYADDLPLRRTLQDVGFEQLSSLDGYIYEYRRVEPAGLPHLVRRARSAVLLGPPRRAYRKGRALLQPVLARRNGG
ncbi:MAG: class I SAM-dependent methyltransferase [Chloroflexi bacterium]|nr:class I SAM-dependent methyltransferase [Chloroflexota bacterium]